MKRCNACGEEFEDKYSFCPVDATPLNSLVAVVVNEHALVDSRAVFDGGNSPPEFVSVSRTVSAKSSSEFHLTIIDNTSLADRLARELRFCSYQVRQAWPAFKRDPIACSRDAVFASGLRLRRALADAERGRRLFVAKGCVTCHLHRAVNETSIAAGPELTGRRFAPEYLARFLADPAAVIPPASGAFGMPNLHLKPTEIAARTAFLNTAGQEASR